MAGSTDESHVRDALLSLANALTIVLPHLPPEMHAVAGEHLSTAFDEIKAIRVRGDSKRKPKTLAEVFTEEDPEGEVKTAGVGWERTG